MSARLSGKLARLAFTAGLACTAMLLLAEPGRAFAVLSGTHGAGEVAGACLRGNGVFTSGSDGSYSCETKKGKVSCDAGGNCVGYCQKCASVTKGGLNGILRPPASAGTASAAGSGTATKRQLPVNNVGGLRVSGGTTGGAIHSVVLQRSTGHSGGSRH
jgi:hypothetical protein